MLNKIGYYVIRENAESTGVSRRNSEDSHFEHTGLPWRRYEIRQSVGFNDGCIFSDIFCPSLFPADFYRPITRPVQSRGVGYIRFF